MPLEPYTRPMQNYSVWKTFSFASTKIAGLIINDFLRNRPKFKVGEIAFKILYHDKRDSSELDLGSIQQSFLAKNREIRSACLFHHSKN